MLITFVKHGQIQVWYNNYQLSMPVNLNSLHEFVINDRTPIALLVALADCITPSRVVNHQLVYRLTTY